MPLYDLSKSYSHKFINLKLLQNGIGEFIAFMTDQRIDTVKAIKQQLRTDRTEGVTCHEIVCVHTSK